MTHPKPVVWIAFAFGSTLVACSDGERTSTPIDIQSAVQDLDLDPSGATTVLTLRSAVAGLTAGNLDSDGGQTPLTVTTTGASVTVTWDERVTPSHRVRVVNAKGVSAAYSAVATTNGAAPTFVISDAQQLPGLGGDLITVQFSGPRVVESDAEDIANWSLVVGGQALSLTGSTFDLDPVSGLLTVVTGPNANLHATFSLAALNLRSVADVALSPTPVAGAANGDSTPPSLLSAEQNLAQDEFGRVIDFTFDEAMDPVFSTSLARFTANAPDMALSVSQPAADVLRVSFNNPIVPGVDSVTLNGLVDAHGNAMANQSTAIAAGSTVANAFASDPELVTVQNAGGDYLLASFEQAIDPDDAQDPTRWELTYDDGGGVVAIDLSSATLVYELPTKTLTIQLADDYRNDAAFTFAGAAGNPPRDVDGEDFTVGFSGQVAGDAAPPLALNAVQRRNLDNLGRTIDIRFNEDLDPSSATTLATWSVTGRTVQSAQLVSARVVRLVVDDVAIPGDATIGIDGLEDLAGNPILTVVAHPFTSSDLRPPKGVASLARAIEGLENDTLFVAFDDRLIPAEIENQANWSFESPIGNVVDLSNATIVYDEDARAATLTFGAATGVDLQTDHDYRVGWSDVRDVGGNWITNDTLTGTIDAEVRLPSVVSTWVEAGAPNVLHVRFSEPCQQLDDLLGFTSYDVYDSTSFLKGSALAAVGDHDRMGVELTFAFGVLAGSDTLALRGVLDAAGNPLFSISGLAVQSEDPAPPALDLGQSNLSAVSGERNDVLELVFDRALSPWGLLDASLFQIEQGGLPLDLSAARFEFDGDRVVTIHLDGFGAPDLQSGLVYDLAVSGVSSAQGVALVGTTLDAVVAGGDSSAPSLPAGWARADASSPTDSVLVTFDEAVEATSAEDVGNYLLNGATAPDSVQLLGMRTVRCVFSGGVAVGDTLDFSGVADLAGNVGVGSRAVSAADVAGPVVLTAQAFSVPGPGGDFVRIQFSRPVDLATALSTQNYSLALGGAALDLTDAHLAWSSASFSVTIVLPAGQELPFGAALAVGATNIRDHAGLVLDPPAALNALVQGDSTPPDFARAFVNYRVSATGAVVDALFTEAVAEGFAQNPLNWTVVGGPFVIGVERRSADHYRLELSGGLPLGGQLQMVSLTDLAGNSAGAISITPVH